MIFKLHDFLPCSTANGPGKRAVFWFQGCEKMCVGCYNKLTWDPHGGKRIHINTAKIRISHSKIFNDIEGVTFTGGEPFLQVPVLRELLENCVEEDLSIVVFTGYTVDELYDVKGAIDLFQYIDILISGPYDREKPSDKPLLGSSNQKVIFLSKRYSESDIDKIPRMEIRISKDSITKTGFPPGKDS